MIFSESLTDDNNIFHFLYTFDEIQFISFSLWKLPLDSKSCIGR